MGPRGKKSIFIRYLEYSKGYVFLGEQANGTVTKFESHDDTFLEDVFPSKGEVRKEDILYEMKDPNFTNIRSIEAQEALPHALEPSRSKVLLQVASELPQPHELSVSQSPLEVVAKISQPLDPSGRGKRKIFPR